VTIGMRRFDAEKRAKARIVLEGSLGPALQPSDCRMNAYQCTERSLIDARAAHGILQDNMLPRNVGRDGAVAIGRYYDEGSRAEGW